MLHCHPGSLGTPLTARRKKCIPLVDLPKQCRRVACPAAASGSNARRRTRQGSSSNQARRRRSANGFGREENEEARKDLAPLDDGAAGLDGQSLRPEYQLYSDPDYKPQRYLGPIQVQTVPGQGRGLVCTTEQEIGTLLVLSPAMMRLEGDLMAPPPEPEELHMAWMEGGLTAAQRRVLDALYDGTDDSEGKEVSLQTLDVKFWSNRGKHDPQAPQVSSGRLLSIINDGACADNMQDPAAMTLLHQKPSSFIGLWPEYTLLNHSCAPNTSITVIQDRMLIHAACEIGTGEQLTRNYIPSLSSAPAPQRRAALQESGYRWTCNCQRCRLEELASPELQDTLQAAYTWYTQEALPKFNAANEGQDLEPLRELLEEAETLVQEIEDAVEREPDLTDQERVLLRAAAYDTYDMLLMCDEFVHQERTAAPLLLSCLELLQAIAPGSDSHVAVALKYDKLMQTRQQMLEAMLKQEQLPRNRTNLAELKSLTSAMEASGEYRLIAWVARYGYINYQMIEALTDAYEIFVEGCEQLSIMKSEGQQESVNELEINGVRVSVVDRMDFTAPPSGLGSDAPTPQYMGVSTRDGFRVSLMEDEGLEQGAQGAWEEGGSQGLGEEADVIDVQAEQVHRGHLEGGAGAVTMVPGAAAVAAAQGADTSGSRQPAKVRQPRMKKKQR